MGAMKRPVTTMVRVSGAAILLLSLAAAGRPSLFMQTTGGLWEVSRNTGGRRTVCVPDPVALARPVTDLGALLARLRPRVGVFAVATSDDRDPTIRTLSSLGIAGEFADLACADDGFPNKPAPDPVLRLCERLGVPPDRTAVVGDSPADLRMGRAAGVARTIAVLTGVGDVATLQPLADILLPSIEDLAPR